MILRIVHYEWEDVCPIQILLNCVILIPQEINENMNLLPSPKKPIIKMSFEVYRPK